MLVSQVPFPRCPSSDVLADLTEGEVRKELASKEEQRLAKGGVLLHKTSAAAFVQMGLELEDAQ